jgi:hypothetical protein
MVQEWPTRVRPEAFYSTGKNMDKYLSRREMVARECENDLSHYYPFVYSICILHYCKNVSNNPCQVHYCENVSNNPHSVQLFTSAYVSSVCPEVESTHLHSQFNIIYALLYQPVVL